MEPGSSDPGTPPLVGFDSQGQPVSRIAGSSPVGEEEFATPAGPELDGIRALKSKTVRRPTRPRRRNTLPTDYRAEPFPARTRLQSALRRVRRLEYAGLDPSSQESQESLFWDSQAQDLHEPLGTRRLWSSSTASTRFDVTVVKSDDMSEGGLGISDRDLAEAGSSGINRQVGQQPLTWEVPEGLNSDTNSVASTVRVPPRIPTPAPRLSRPGTPAIVNPPASQPNTPILQPRALNALQPQAPPVVELQPEIQVWLQRVERAFQDADDTVLLYRGQRVRAGRADDIRAEAERLSRLLRDCHPHCNEDLRATVKTYRERLAEMCVQLEQASIDPVSQDSRQVTGNLSQSPSGRSTPSGFYNDYRDPHQRPLGEQAQERPARNKSGGCGGLGHGRDDIGGRDRQGRPACDNLDGLSNLGRGFSGGGGQEQPQGDFSGVHAGLGRGRENSSGRQGQGYDRDPGGDRGFYGGARGAGGDRGGGGPHDY